MQVPGTYARFGPYLPVALTPNLPEVLLAALDTALDGVHTAKPGRVKAYDRTKQVADIEICVKKVYDDEQGERTVEAYPILPSVPVAFAGGGGYRTTYPVQAGDTCLLVFTDCSTDTFLAIGGVVDPGMTNRRHALSDAVAILGLRDLKRSLKGLDGSGAPASSMSVGKDDGPTIEIDPNHVYVGGIDDTEKTFKAQSFMTALSTMFDAISSAISPIVGGGATAATAISTAKTAFVTAANDAMTDIARVK